MWRGVVPEAAVSWSGPISPTLLANFSGGIKDRVSLLNIMIFFHASARKQTIAKQPKTTTATYSGKRKTNKYIKETKNKRRRIVLQPTARSSDRGPTAGVSGRAPSATVGKGSLYFMLMARLIKFIRLNTFDTQGQLGPVKKFGGW